MVTTRNKSETLDKQFVLERSAWTPYCGCWIWMSHSDSKGYGKIRRRGEVFAHRFAYRTFTGDFPKEMCVLHKCDTPSCVNPDHLFLGDRADNRMDMVAKGRQKSPKTVFKKGEMSERSKKAWALRKLAMSHTEYDN